MRDVSRKIIALVITISLVLAILAGPVNATAWGESSYNDNFDSAQLIYLGDSVDGQISYGYHDVYAVEVMDQESITIETDVGTGADIHVFVYDPYENPLRNWVQASGTEKEVNVSTPENGTYYIHIQSAQYENLITNYTVAVSAVPYEMPWEAIGVVFSVLLVGGSGLVKIVRRRRGKPVPVSA